MRTSEHRSLKPHQRKKRDPAQISLSLDDIYLVPVEGFREDPPLDHDSIIDQRQIKPDHILVIC